MFSYEVYAKTRRDVIQILTADDGLSKEDILMIRSLAESDNPRLIFDLAKELKDEGNMCFKKGMINEALNKYGFAGLIVTCYEFGEEDRDEFFDLLTPILLNFAACFLKKEVFDYVGLICSLILEFNPEHTKALFRRATAAIGLGRSDLARWDLLVASKIDPTNKEIRDKLNQINCNAPEKTHDQQDVPIGLGLGVPPKKKKKIDSSKNQKGNEDISVSMVEEKEMNSLKDFEGKKGDMHKEAQTDILMEEGESVVEVAHDKVKGSSNSAEEGAGYKEVYAPNVVVVEDVADCSTIEKTNLAESEYRFYNRRKADSYLSFKGEICQKLRAGKSLHYVNSRAGSYMTIKMVPKPKTSSQQEATVKEMSSVDITHTTLPVQDQVADEQMEEYEQATLYEGLDAKNTELKMKEEETNGEGLSSPAKAMDEGSFGLSIPTQCDHKINQKEIRRLWKAPWKKLTARPQTLYGAGKRVAKKRKALNALTNLSVCRFQLQGRKRRLVIPPSEACSDRRKKCLRGDHVSIVGSRIDHVSSASRVQLCIESRSSSSVEPQISHDMASAN